MRTATSLLYVCFVGLSSSFTARPRWLPTFSVARHTTVVCRAIIYGLDDDDNSDKPYKEEEVSIDLFGEKRTDPEVIESINQNQGALARMAVAFSPPEHSFTLKDIEHVGVINIGESHLNIEAILCEDQGCVNVAVPVRFVNPCVENEALNDCIAENLYALDAQASNIIKNNEWQEENHEQVQASERQMQALKDTNEPVELPSWWVAPDSSDLIAECSFLRDVLNERDFSSEVEKLASQTISSLLGENINVNQAAVAAVGPAGLVIRGSYVENSRSEIIEIPVHFDQVMTEKGALREAVLSKVSPA